MGDELINLIKSGGRAAAPLAVGGWGAYLLPITAGYPTPFNLYGPWVCFGAMVSGAVAASVTVLWKAFEPPAKWLAGQLRKKKAR